MYKSPINLIGNTVEEFAKKVDGAIWTAVVKCIPDVDKEELEKALRYDRAQYCKGYSDAMSELVRCKECIHKKDCNHTRALGINGYCSEGERQ